MANVKFSAITASGGNPASTDRLVGVTAGNADVLFTRAQLDASIAPAAANVTGLAAVATSGSASDLSAGTVAAARLSTATTQAAGDNTTKIATDAFVMTAVANAIAGVNPAVAVQAATTAAADTSGFTYSNGVAGIGATFTGSVNTAVTIDGFTFTALGQRLLVKNDTQAPSGAFNGVYNVTQLQTGILPPILTRALDYDAPSDINNTGAIPVVNGTANANTSWLLTSTVNTVGTDPLTYTKFSINPATLAAIATSGSGADLTAASVTYAKMQNESATTLLGNPTGGAAAPSEITLGLGLLFSSTTLVSPVHPGYVANNWYTPWPTASRGSSAALVSGTTYFVPVFLATKMHMHALAIGIQTLHAGGSIALGLYSNNSGASPAVNRPGNLLSNTGSISTASTGFFSAALGSDQIVGPGWYWLAFQTNDTTVRVQSLSADPSIAAFLGSATGSNVLTNTNASIQSVSVTGTFATWISDASGSSFTENTAVLAPVVAFQPSSVP